MIDEDTARDTARPFDGRTPAEIEMIQFVTTQLTEIWTELREIRRQLEELRGVSGSFVFGKSTSNVLAHYEMAKLRDPSLTKKEFARRLGIPVNRLYMATKRKRKT